MAKFTSGVWEYDEIDNAIYAGDEQIVVAYPNGLQFRTDAYLVEAAPELFWFTQQIFNGLETGLLSIDTPADETLSNVLDRGRKALSKAEGKQ